MALEQITLGAGCFWCIENIFSRVKGVSSAISGYADGDVDNPTYEQVCSGSTNHAEVVQLTFDPNVISVDNILVVFFAIHDPTTLNRQGNDVGSQYRSTIIYHNNEQKLAAEKKMASLMTSKVFSQPIVTSIVAINNFYSAESYHQDYYNNNSDNQYCQLVVAKKIQRFLSEFAHLLKK
jgi:peptide-methionine (S)-S-oxide reductase